MEIVKPTGAQALAYEDPDTVLVQGGGFDGALLPDGSNWTWISPQPGALVASYDTPTRTWTVEQGGVTYVLEPAFDQDWDALGFEPTRWHVVQSSDASGNRVDYTWSGARIESIAYGGLGPAGTAPSGEEHFLEVAFLYSPVGAVFRSASGGVLEVANERLSAVEVRSAYERASAIPRLRYELFYDGDYELLEQIDQVEILEDGTEGARRMLASMTYTQLFSGWDQTAAAPVMIAQNVSKSATDGTSASSTQAGLYDSSGDGLPDMVSSIPYIDSDSDGVADSWVASWQRLDRPDPNDQDLLDRWWEDPFAPDPDHTVLSPGGHLDDMRTVPILETTSSGGETYVEYGTYGYRRWLDINSDGFMDLIQAPNAPAAWDGVTDVAALNGDPAPTQWEVWYGAHEVFPSPSVMESAPFPFPLVTTRPQLEENDWFPQEIDGLQGATVDLLDVDGDGWSDVVQVVPPSTLRVWFRIPGEGSGWESTSQDISIPSSGLDSFQESTGVVLNDSAWPTWEFDTNEDVRVPVFVFMEARTGFMDINGDGALDFVDTRGWNAAASEWEVWLGKGEGYFSDSPYAWPSPVRWLSRTDEGEPYADVCSINIASTPDLELIAYYGDEVAHDGGMVETGGQPPPSNCTPNQHSGGRPSAQFGGLLDMDGDGRQDLVDGEAGTWHRNLGDGFDPVGTSLPAWFPTADVGISGTSHDYSGSGILSQGWTYQTVAVSDQPSYPPAPSDSVASSSVNRQLLTVQDLDRDGLPDVVDARDPSLPIVQYSGRDTPQIGVTIGGTRPGLLKEIVLGTGATTSLEYRSSAVVWPSGETDYIHKTSTRKDLVAAIEVYDPLQDWASREERTYLEGEVRQGRWLGFHDVEVDYYSWEPDIEAGLAATDWSWMGATDTHYSLSNGGHWPQPLTRDVYTNRAADFVPGWSGPVDAYLRRTTDWTYSWHGVSGTLQAPWVSSVEVTAFNERRTDPNDVVGRTTILDITYDSVGNVVSQHHTAIGSPQDELQVETHWVGNANDSLWVPRWIRTSSYDPVNGSVQPVEEAWFAYDGGTTSTAPTAGLLTIQEVCAGLPGANLCAEKLIWEFDRTARGAVTEIRAPAGRDTFFDQLAFGETLALEESNALWPVATVRQVDDLGRVWEEVDPNGVGRRTYADAFGRTTSTEIRGAGSTWRLETAVTYQDTTTPNYVHTERTTYLPNGGIDTVLSEYQLLDGFGDVLQTWTPADTGFIVQESERDARGNVRLTTEPHRETTFSTDYASTRNSVLQSWGYFDLYGDPLLSWSIASGTTAFEHPQPSSTIAFMEEYYEKEEVHDSLGRLVEVWQGQPSMVGPLTRTGLYAYDGRDRVRSFTDAAGNVYEYDLDGAGRTRQVWRTPAGGITSPYFGFEWSGPDPIEMYEGLAGSGALVVEWYYDALGRTEQKDVYDPLTGGVLSWTWEWDEAVGKPTWYGARQRVTDPTGFVSYTYDPDPVFGGFGWPTDLTRTWTTTPSKVASFDFTYDYAGRVVQQTWPSGAVVDHSFHANGWPLQDDVTSGGTHVQVTHGYDAYGLPDDWVVDLNAGAAVWTQDLTRANSQQPYDVQWTESPTGFTQSLLWTWLDNGWLHQKHGIFPEPITYGYDLSRITSVHSGTLGMLETYSYDLGHNPVEHYRRNVGPDSALVLDDVWTYDPAPQFNEVPSRRRPLPPGYGASHVVEDFTYDPATSRLLTWDTDDPVNGDIYRDFVYDGAGHLLQMWRDEPSFTQVTTLDHDVDDNVVYEHRSRNGVSRHIWRFNGWKEESSTGRVIEQVLPMVRLDGAGVRVVLAELDGHALRTRSPTGAQTFEVLGAYGMPVIGVGSAVPWVLDHLHGGEPDRDDEIMHFGARHMVLRDGLWMQPEPLLHLGLTNGDLSNPIGFSGLYSAGNTNVYQDRSGYMAATTAALVVTTTTYSWTSIGVAAGGAVQSAGGLGIAAANAAGATGLATAFATANKALSEATTALISSVGNTPLGADVTIPSFEVVPLDTASAGGDPVQTAVDMVKDSGATVKANPKASNQEGNVTLDFGDGDRVNLRVETHPLEPGGDPVRHANVEVIETTAKGKSKKVQNEHILEEPE